MTEPVHIKEILTLEDRLGQTGAGRNKQQWNFIQMRARDPFRPHPAWGGFYS